MNEAIEDDDRAPHLVSHDRGPYRDEIEDLIDELDAGYGVSVKNIFSKYWYHRKHAGKEYLDRYKDEILTQFVSYCQNKGASVTTLFEVMVEKGEYVYLSRFIYKLQRDTEKVTLKPILTRGLCWQLIQSKPQLEAVKVFLSAGVDVDLKIDGGLSARELLSGKIAHARESGDGSEKFLLEIERCFPRFLQAEVIKPTELVTTFASLTAGKTSNRMDVEHEGDEDRGWCVPFGDQPSSSTPRPSGDSFGFDEGPWPDFTSAQGEMDKSSEQNKQEAKEHTLSKSSHRKRSWGEEEALAAKKAKLCSDVDPWQAPDLQPFKPFSSGPPSEGFHLGVSSATNAYSKVTRALQSQPKPSNLTTTVKKTEGKKTQPAKGKKTGKKLAVNPASRPAASVALQPG